MSEDGTKGKLAERLLDYAVRAIAVAQALPKTGTGKHIGMQLLRSGTSAGANYNEARASESRKDFIHKMQIVLKELREALYWLRVIERAKMLPGKRMKSILVESDELIAMTVSSIVTTRKGRNGRAHNEKRRTNRE